jgi:hypothetical protein
MNIQIEEDLNNYLKSISYSNEKLTRVRLILIIRNDDFSALGGEYDAAFPMTTGYCQLLTVAQYETQATTETEKALKVSIIYLQF